MLVHSVYFWLRDDLRAEEKETFLQGLESLKAVESIRHAWVGAPGPMDRPVVERSYSYALIVVFDDITGHDEYQVHPLHKRFIEACSGFWTKVVIYDSMESEPRG